MSKPKNAGASRTDSDPVDLTFSQDIRSFSVTSASYTRCLFPNSSVEEINKFQVSMNLVEHQSIEDNGKHTIGDLNLNLDIQLGRSGSNVFLGSYKNRTVAVKRSHCIKSGNIELTRLSLYDSHPNIVRVHGFLSDSKHNYLCLELCKCSLDTLVSFCTSKEVGGAESDADKDLIKLMQGKQLWFPNSNPSKRNPSKTLLDLMRNIVSALDYLHKSSIVHTTINPENILVTDTLTILTAKLSNFSGSILLPEKISTSFINRNLGWQPNENPPTYALDMFSFGCILFYSLTCGHHPFGYEKNRVINVANNNPICLSEVNHLPEAKQLISSLLKSDPQLRPSASDVLIHPMFWDTTMKNQFIVDASNIFVAKANIWNILTDSEISRTTLVAMDWDKQIDQNVLVSMKRSYDGNSFKDLVRFFRHCQSHFSEIEIIKRTMGDLPNGFNSYFATRFPDLLMVVYELISKHHKSDLKVYFKKTP